MLYYPVAGLAALDQLAGWRGRCVLNGSRWRCRDIGGVRTSSAISAAWTIAETGTSSARARLKLGHPYLPGLELAPGSRSPAVASRCGHVGHDAPLAYGGRVSMSCRFGCVSARS
jgi:hypothetical protein